MGDAVIVSAVRTAVGKSHRGTLRQTRPEDLAAAVIKEAIARAGSLPPQEVEDVVLGCAIPEAEQGNNLARVSSLLAGLPTSVPAMTVNRFCSSGLQSIALAAQQIKSGMAHSVLAGGVESMSMVPMTGNKVAPHPYLVEQMPQVYMSMGHTAEEVAKRFGISRAEQDAFALASHQKAATALERKAFAAEIVPLLVKLSRYDAEAGQVDVQEVVFEQDEGVRRETHLDALAKLRPAFSVQGTVTAGNSSQTSDGAAALLVMSEERAVALHLKPLAVFRSFAVGGVDPEIMGVGPVVAIPKALQLAGLSMAQIDLFEINEAFAAQCLRVIQALQIDPDRVNVNGGAIALGHPLGCTGAKLSVTLLHEMRRRRLKYGVVSMCIGGGMGAAGVFEVF